MSFPTHIDAKGAAVNIERNAKAPTAAPIGRSPPASTTGLFAGLASLHRAKGSGAPRAKARTCAALSACLPLLFLALLAPSAHAADFGFKAVDVTFENADGTTASQAGSHPFAMTTFVEFNSEEDALLGHPVLAADTKDLDVFQIPGFVGNPTAVPPCPLDLFFQGEPQCPLGSVVGETTVTVTNGTETFEVPVYNLPPPVGSAARIGFKVLAEPVVVDLGVNPVPPYNVLARVHDVSQILAFYSSKLTIWGNPADPAHDADRGGAVNIPNQPFITLPRACQGPLTTTFSADSWQDPGTFVSTSVETHDEGGEPLGFLGCDRLAFSPSITAEPTAKAASSPTGLDFSLDVSDEGLTNPEGLAQSDIRRTVVTLPEGFTANPALAAGLEVCSEAQLAAETAFSAPGAGCPNASKIGTIEVETPLLEEDLDGALFIAKPYENPFGSLLALYVVIKNPTLGIVIKQPLEVEADPATGQITTVAEDLPQLPFSHFRLHFREGARSPLITPPACGTYDGAETAPGVHNPEPVKAVLTPSSGGPPITTTSAFQIITGPDEGPCPAGPAPFHPGFSAGTLNNSAGRYSPFVMRLTRGDGEQDMGRFSFVLPPGVVPKLAGIPYCPEAGIAQAKSRTGEHGGTQELADPSCPAASQIGRTLAGAGVGSQLTYVPGKLYLAGPYHGDPISAVSITPAVAGPFDAGTVVVREALRLNPVTHVGEVDGSASDPIPHILQGIPLNVRDLRVYADRPEFTLNATSCEPLQASSTIWGDGTALLPTGFTAATLSSRYQAADCAALGFRPKLTIELKGSTKRGGHPALKATVKTRPGDANFAGAVVTLPNSAFLDQSHLNNICTRVQFAEAGGNGAGCPPASVYGHARAKTPLLDEALEGPVYLRSNPSHNLPDLVVALHGLVDIELASRIDSHHGGIRSSFEAIPDAPVTEFTLEMQGGRKGLIENSPPGLSRSLCESTNRATAKLIGQNGRRVTLRPALKVQCKKGRKGKGGRGGHRAKRHR
jgi:hypothetical protein